VVGNNSQLGLFTFGFLLPTIFIRRNINNHPKQQTLYEVTVCFILLKTTR